jgi:predicted nucleotidyltransferase
MTSPNLHVDEHRLAEFCRKWKVTELSLFGSVLREDFRSDSDVDVLVSFERDADWSLLDLVSMQNELSAMLARDVDLVEEAALRNPFRRSTILKSKQTVYAA